jgi:hypothetical protein
MIRFAVGLVGFLVRFLAPQQVQNLARMTAAQLDQLLVPAIQIMACTGPRLQMLPETGDFLPRIAPAQAIHHGGMAGAELSIFQCLPALLLQSCELIQQAGLLGDDLFQGRDIAFRD